MIISDIKTGKITTSLKRPFKTSLRTIEHIESILIEISTDSAIKGYGGASPTAVITGDTDGSIVNAVQIIAERIRGLDINNFEIIMQEINNSLIGNTSAKAAVDMAVYDLYGKLYKTPVYKILGGFRNILITDLTISLNSTEKMVEDSMDAVSQGVKTLKVKLGANTETDFVGMLAIREAVGPGIKLRVDANQAWKPKEAVELIIQMQRAGIELDFVEQPVAAEDYDGMRYVKDRVSIPIIADESVFSPKDALRLVNMSAADGINIKLMKSGGIYNAIKIVDIAEAAGLFCMVGSMMESHVGVTAAAHLAASRAVISEVDLDVPLLCNEKKEKGGAEYNGISIILPESSGLGMLNQG
jgi:L-Ala-D/L-Glu epimerase / N-acetyl-D-glutamate racemase